MTFDPSRQLSEGEFSLRGFDARRLLTFARELPFPPDMLARAQPLVVDGQVQELSMRFDARGAPSRYRMNARFTGLSASYDDGSQPPPVDGELNPGWPSFEGLDGSVQVSEKDGRLSLRGAESAVTLPGILTRPRIPLDHFRAELDWQVQASATDPDAPAVAPIVDVYLRDIEFGNADGEGRIHGTYRRVPGTAGQIDLTSEVTGVPLPRLRDYLPLTLLGDVREWLEQAALSGTADSLRLRVRGQLHDFPFRQPGSGEFQMRVDMSDVHFRYGREWPAITGASGMFSLQRGGMTARIDQGRVFDTRIRRASFEVPDFRQPVLEVNGRFDGPAQQVIRYINESPIGRRLDGFFQNTRLSGPASTNLLLRLPLRNFDHFTITGESQLEGSRLELAGHLPVFDAIRGKVRFTENGIAFDKVSASLLGGPVTLDAVSPRRGLLEINAQGRASADGLRRFADTPITRQLEGSTRYRAGLSVDRGAVSLDVRTNLAGMRSRLPPPFDKEADTPAMLDIELRPQERARDGQVVAETLRLTVRDDAHLLFARRADARGRLRVRAGTLAVGQPPVLPASGLSGRGPRPAGRCRCLVVVRDPRSPAACAATARRRLLCCPTCARTACPSPRRGLMPCGRDFNALVAGVSQQIAGRSVCAPTNWTAT
ncbi:MAG: DUF3971 domain-containing protein [Burkholderiaceae bacterium]